MLDKSKMVGFVPTTDYEAAREFYVGKLGFTFVSLDQFALVVDGGRAKDPDHEDSQLFRRCRGRSWDGKWKDRGCGEVAGATASGDGENIRL